jgi:hypothetical protein
VGTCRCFFFFSFVRVSLQCAVLCTGCRRASGQGLSGSLMFLDPVFVFGFLLLRWCSLGLCAIPLHCRPGCGAWGLPLCPPSFSDRFLPRPGSSPVLFVLHFVSVELWLSILCAGLLMWRVYLGSMVGVVVAATWALVVRDYCKLLWNH